MMATNLIIDKESKTLPPVWQIMRGHLESKKSQIAEEILYYPPPIPACDAQFNFLLAERARVSQALVQLDTLANQDSSTQDQLLSFVSSLPGLDDGVVEELYAVLAE